ncbi:MAG: aspartate dehydrogenase [Candidatus Omnitrophota bacterium]
MTKKTIGIIGCGAIGTALAEYADKNLMAYIDKIVLYDNVVGTAEILVKKLKNASIAGSEVELIKKVDLVIEAASPEAVRGLLKEVFARKKDIMIMSVGGLLGNEGFIDEARKKGLRLMLPSGAIAGIDGLKSAAIAGIESVTLITRKGPKSIKGAPFLLENHIDAEKITKETVIFEGSAAEAVKGFPKNINVSALLSIAGVGAEKTKVKIVVSPEYTKNIHEIEIKSKAGIITTRSENVPSPENPKTSYLAALAAIASLKGYFDTVQIGT